jgi:pseudouridine kinase
MEPGESNKDRLLDLIRLNPYISQQELADRLGIKRSSVASHIAQLIRDHRLLGRAYILPGVEPVLVAGGANLDHLARATGPVIMGTSNPVVVQEHFGGIARNVAENLARMGLPVRLLSAVGDDRFGDALLQDARGLGIDTSATLVVRGAATGQFTAVLGPEGELIIALTDMGVIDRLDLDALESLRHLWASTRMRVLDLNLAAPVIAELIEDSLRVGAILVGVGVPEPKMNRLPASLKGLSVLVLNVGELSALAGRRVAGDAALRRACLELLDRGLEGVVVTRAAKGVVCCTEAGFRWLPAAPGKVVDFTGAADAFTSGLVAGLAHDPRDLPRACEIGQRVAVRTLADRWTGSHSIKPSFLKDCGLAPAEGPSPIPPQ